MEASEASTAGIVGPVLSVWAHPDDETYLAAGAMAAAVRDGHRVVCVTATRGEQGSTDPQRWPPGEELAAVRTVELERALAHLGVHEHHWLDYPDGGCADVDEGEAVARIRGLLDEVDPRLVLTFAPDGQTGHSDHITVSRWVGLAVDSLSGERPRPRVLHARASSEWLARWRPVLEPLGVYMGFEPVSTPRAELALCLDLDGDLLAAKMNALREQASQTEAVIAALGEEFMSEGLREEGFVEG
ncbi:MAG TPA: PIG-L family deacetylase [Actinomycetes bacterium]|nr:PIG-L family deacetylase [Actinomycetes bacterium]